MSLYLTFHKNVLENQTPVLSKPGDWDATLDTVRGWRFNWPPELVQHLDALEQRLVRSALWNFECVQEPDIMEGIQERRDEFKVEDYLDGLHSNSIRQRRRMIALFDLALIVLDRSNAPETRLAALACLFEPVNALFDKDWKKAHLLALEQVRLYELELKGTGKLEEL